MSVTEHFVIDAVCATCASDLWVLFSVVTGHWSVRFVLFPVLVSIVHFVASFCQKSYSIDSSKNGSRLPPLSLRIVLNDLDLKSCQKNLALRSCELSTK